MESKEISKEIPTILVIFGVTGDLAAKKIIPSLWHLFEQNLLPDNISVIGFSRRDFSAQEFKDYVFDSVKKRSGENVTSEKFSKFFVTFSYQNGTFEDEKAYQALVNKISETENLWGICANKLFYLAVPPINYDLIFKNLAAVKLNIPCGGKLGWSRILIEKPFGTNLATARKLQTLLSSYFKEEQIYRIDHYLFKEIVQGIENFRFSNNLFENIWDNSTIDSIDLQLHEKIGVEDRGSFYDQVGALRDVGQNHLLSMLAALTMEYPSNEEETGIRKTRAKILEALLPWRREILTKNTFRAQYKGYKEIQDVTPNSNTETYFALKTELLHPKWKGVSITLSAGKRMGEVRKEIVLTLKHPKVCHLCEIRKHTPNRIVFRLEPRDEIVIHFWTKKPGFERVLEERTFSFFLYKKQTKVQYVEEYAKVLYHAIHADQSLFISQNEVEAQWKFADPVIEAWKENLAPLLKYKPDTTPAPELDKSARGNMIKKGKVKINEIGIIGLGKMGANLAKQLVSKGWKVYGYNRTYEVTKVYESEGILGTHSLEELVEKLKNPRTIWLMASYQAVDEVLNELVPLLEKGDTIIDGGNSPYKDSIRRSKDLDKSGINFLDVGVSGGPDGALNGACIMVGGKKELYERHEPLFRDLSIKDGYGYMGNASAGHFVKMVHNGIEYGMMQSIGEGFEILKKSPFSLDLYSVADLYNHGSVITSRLVGWLKDAYAKFGDDLNTQECCSGKVSQSGEGKWTVETAREMDVPVEIIEGAVEFRKKSQGKPSYTGQVVSALRHEFGGHNVRSKK
ncbi:MAG: glucose-6-phosphate dehydrogenase [Candidatus Levybacteria bacterium]|nr:glucose-6-phosphate dehydrogenase [Candidatus Levybacteria bacterium]